MGSTSLRPATLRSGAALESAPATGTPSPALRERRGVMHPAAYTARKSLAARLVLRNRRGINSGAD
jgi:hypothetical protein